MTSLLTLHNAYITFGNKPLFNDLSLNIHEGSKICLIGKNGAGKTTLMKAITGEHELDGGKYWKLPGTVIGYLKQTPPHNLDQTIFDYISSALPKEKQTKDYEYMVSMVAKPLELNVTASLKDLSGGQLRRACLAHALVEEPDILLLDEPTNHLDIGVIEWLEEYLKAYRGTLICVSHDKRFLANISNKVFWLDRGTIKVCPRGYSYFDEWSQMLLEQEERELKNRAKMVAQEVEWASRGVKARRTRNERRLAKMREERDRLKRDQSSFRQIMSKVALPTATKEISSKIVAEFYNVSKSFTDGNKKKEILLQFNLRVLRGDRIGLLGKNGSGKTSFLKLLVGELQPDSGTIKVGKNLKISYFDQRRKDLDPKNTLWKTLSPSGNDYIEVGKKSRHVCGYLKDFLFDPKDAHNLVATLSGGQQNRLMLAKTLANPGQFLILDEPTNDLDMETLEMLEEILVNYQGTLFIVSHDRDFLDNTVNRIFAFEGDGKIEGYIGGYSDYLKEKNQHLEHKIIKDKKEKIETKNKLTNKLSYKLQFELDNLPKEIKILTQELNEINQKLANPDFYENNRDEFTELLKISAEKQKQLDQKEERWLELEELSEQN